MTFNVKSLNGKCQTCNKEIPNIRHPTINDHVNRGRFCSKNCKYKYYAKYATAPCATCGALIKKRRCKPHTKYCSEKCKHLGSSHKVERRCILCSKSFLTKPNRTKKGWGKFCSKTCRDIYVRGENHPNWKGGTSYEPYCPLFNDKFKTRVRDFFENRCAECGKSELENRKKLSVHHVNYDKQTCCKEGESVGNRKFVALCHSHHTRTNSHRAFWEDWYTEIINEFYSGRCY